MATGDNVSKANLYSVPSPSIGDGVSKANLYGVLIAAGIATAESVSKANLYAVLIPGNAVRPVVQVCG